jgi:cytosine/adenosine deaminase-related metal-dependent hydrolase
MIAFRARLVFPVSSPPIRDGVVVVADRRIVQVGEAAGASAVGASEIQDLGNVALLPGLVNAHTHLEFSKLVAPLGEPGMVFPDWIREVIRYRWSLTERYGASMFASAVYSGLEQSYRAGTRRLGEIATGDWSLAPFAEADFAGTLFHELIGLRQERAESLLAQLPAMLDTDDRFQSTDDWQRGLSPHAPYTVHPQLFAGAVQFATERGLPLAFHLAESREELELLHSGSGPFLSLLTDLGAWDADAIPRGTRPIDYLQTLAASGARSLVIHGNYLQADEQALLGQHADRLSVVYCPRTHAFFGHERHPLPALLKAGARVALGTDSRASNPDLSILAEMRHVARTFPDVSPATILAMGTLHGAQALGCDATHGSLQPGKTADFITVALPPADGDPYELLFNSSLPVVVPVPT